MANPSGGNQLLEPKNILNTFGVEPGQQVADLGCGATGHFAFPAAAMVGPAGTVYAVDIRKIVLAGIKNRARLDGVENLKTVWANLEILKSTGLADNSLDVSLLLNMLFQSSKKAEVINEALRLTKPDGYLGIVDWRSGVTGLGPEASVRVDQKWLIDYCVTHGCELEKQFEPSNYHFGLLFKKK